MSDTEKYDTTTKQLLESPAAGARSETLPPRFEVKGELGRGGMGAVFWAFDKKLQKEVAVKLLTGDIEDDSLTQRFRQEAKELSSFTHPNIVTLLDFGAFEGQDFIVLEFLRGGNLKDWLAKGPSLADIADRFISIALGLDYIHNRGIVHRDLKPENILMTEEGEPCITDFGIARRLEKQTRFTQAGTILGTTTHMAPEQIMSSEVGPPADLYSLGVCLFEALTGSPPFTGNQHFALLQAHLTETAPSVRSRRADVPEELDRLVTRMLKKKPEERPASAQEVVGALRDVPFGSGVPVAASSGLVARPEVWNGLLSQLESAKNGEGVSCHLVGPTGSGRSTLLKQFCQEAKLRGIRTLVLTPCHEPTETLKRLWHILGPTCPLQEILAYEGATGCATWLRKRLEASSQPTILIADDSERHYPTTLAVLRALGQLTPPPSSGWIISSTPAQRIAEGSGVTIELTPWHRKGLDTLFKATRGVDPSPELSLWLEARSAGWPRQAKLLINSLTDQTVDPPSDLNSLITGSLDRLSENARLVLEVLCLAHQPAPYELLLVGSALAHRSLDRGLAELVEAGFAEEDWAQSDCFRVAHDIYREFVMRQIPERTLRRLHLAMANYYEKFEQSTLRGRHLLASGDREKAYPVLLEEADMAKELGFLPLAHNLLKSALSCSSHQPNDMAEGQCRLAEVALAIGSIEESRKILDETAPRTLPCQLQADLVRATMANLQSAPIDESILLTPRGAMPSTVREVHLSITLHRQLAKAAVRQDEFERAGEHLEAAFKLASNLGEAEPLGQVLIASGYLKLRQGEAAEAEVEARQAIEKTKHSENPRWKAKSFELLGEVQMALGAPSRAALSFQQALEISRDALLDKRCLKLERKFHKAQKGEPFTPNPRVTPPADTAPAAGSAAAPVVATPSLSAAPVAVAAVADATRAPETAPLPPATAPPPAMTPQAVADLAPRASEPDVQAAAASAPDTGPDTAGSVREEIPIVDRERTVDDRSSKKNPVPWVVAALVACAVLSVGGNKAYRGWASTPGHVVVGSKPAKVTVSSPSWPAPRTLSAGETLDFAPGSYELTFSADGFATEKRTVKVERDGNSKLDIVLAPTQGTVKFVALPAQAMVTVKGEKRPDLKTGSSLTLRGGTYTILVEKPFYKPKKVDVVIEPGQSKELSIALEPLRGDLSISKLPADATVVLLDDANQKVASPKNLKPGKYLAKVTREGYWADEKSVVVKAGEVAKLDFKLSAIVKEAPPQVVEQTAPSYNDPGPTYNDPPPPPPSGSGGSGGGSDLPWR